MENDLKALFERTDLDYRLFLNWLLGYLAGSDDKRLGKKISEALACQNKRRAEFDKIVLKMGD